MPTEVFVSHSHVDQDFAERLVGVLRRHRIPVWYSDTDIQGAQQWHDEIGRALQRCDWFIVVLSPESVASMWVKRDLCTPSIRTGSRGASLRCCIERVTTTRYPGPWLSCR